MSKETFPEISRREEAEANERSAEWAEKAVPEARQDASASLAMWRRVPVEELALRGHVEEMAQKARVDEMAREENLPEVAGRMEFLVAREEARF